MNDRVSRCHDCTAPQTEVDMLSRHILELQADKGRLTDRVRELEQKLEKTEKDLADYQFNYPTIKELEKEKAELKGRNAELKGMYTHSAREAGTYKQFLELKEKENVELKAENQKWKDEWQEQVQKATDEGYARTLQTIQLTKAKELLKEFVRHYKAKTIYVENMQDLLEQSEQFLKEVEK